MRGRRVRYAEIVRARRRLRADGHEAKFATLAEAGWDGEFVSPPQVLSDDRRGPVVMGSHWLDLGSACRRRRAIERYGGHLPDIPFNRVLDLALWNARLNRRDVYLTQICHLLPRRDRTAEVPFELLRTSFEQVTRHELHGRPVIVLGLTAERACKALGVPNCTYLDHPSRRGRTFRDKAEELGKVLEAAADTAIPSAKERRR